MLLDIEQDQDFVAAKSKFATDVASMNQSDQFGLKNCKTSWGDLLKKLIIFEAFECKKSVNLNQLEVDCLKGKISKNLTTNCC